MRCIYWKKYGSDVPNLQPEMHQVVLMWKICSNINMSRTLIYMKRKKFIVHLLLCTDIREIFS